MNDAERDLEMVGHPFAGKSERLYTLSEAREVIAAEADATRMSAPAERAEALAEAERCDELAATLLDTTPPNHIFVVAPTDRAFIARCLRSHAERLRQHTGVEAVKWHKPPEPLLRAVTDAIDASLAQKFGTRDAARGALLAVADWLSAQAQPTASREPEALVVPGPEIETGFDDVPGNMTVSVSGPRKCDG